MAGFASTGADRDSGATAGWLIVREDGVIVAADQRAIALVGAKTLTMLLGRAWTSLVSATEAPLLAMAVAAFERGEAWSGALSFQLEEERLLLAVSLVPRTPGRGDVALISLAPIAIADAATPTTGAASSDERHDLEVLVDAIEASAELRDAEAIARAVLQAIRPALRFEWGVVLRLFHQDHFVTPAAAEVVATYPTGLAGVDAGAAWAPLGAPALHDIALHEAVNVAVARGEEGALCVRPLASVCRRRSSPASDCSLAPWSHDVLEPARRCQPLWCLGAHQPRGGERRELRGHALVHRHPYGEQVLEAAEGRRPRGVGGLVAVRQRRPGARPLGGHDRPAQRVTHEEDEGGALSAEQRLQEWRHQRILRALVKEHRRRLPEATPLRP